MSCFYFPQLTGKDDRIELSGDEVRHAVGARRLRVGDKLLLFNGHGLIADVEIERVLRNRLTASVISVEQRDPPATQLLLASAIPKGDRINSLLDMSTQLGMTLFVPLICERSVVQVSDPKLQRFNRICINACKQSRRYFVPKIHPALSLPEMLGKYDDPETVILLADLAGQPITTNGIRRKLIDTPRRIIIVVGPEGGFSESEAALMASHRVLNVRLSDAILRIETACVCALSQLQMAR